MTQSIFVQAIQGCIRDEIAETLVELSAHAHGAPVTEYDLEPEMARRVDHLVKSFSDKEILREALGTLNLAVGRRVITSALQNLQRASL